MQEPPWSCERILPPQTGKSGHVSVGRVKFGLVLDRQGSKVCVCRQVARSASRFKESEQNIRMTVSRVNDYRLRSDEPGSNARAGTADVERILENLRIRGDADETQDSNPWKANALGSVHQRLPPFSRRLVPTGLRIVGVQQQVDVGNNHRPYRTAVSSVSISSTS